MIYLQNISDSQVVFIPKSGMATGGDLTIRMRNTIDQDIIIDQVVDLNTSELYYNLAVTLPAGCPDGEYEYALMDEDIVLSTGIAILGEMEQQPSEYNKDIEYEQYN